MNTPGYFPLWYTPSYMTGTLCMCKDMPLLWVAVGQVMVLRRIPSGKSVWVAEVLKQKRAVPYDTTPRFINNDKYLFLLRVVLRKI